HTVICTLSLHDALPILGRDEGHNAFERAAGVEACLGHRVCSLRAARVGATRPDYFVLDQDFISGPGPFLSRARGVSREPIHMFRSEEHTSELQSPYDLV